MGLFRGPDGNTYTSYSAYLRSQGREEQRIKKEASAARATTANQMYAASQQQAQATIAAAAQHAAEAEAVRAQQAAQLEAGKKSLTEAKAEAIEGIQTGVDTATGEIRTATTEAQESLAPWRTAGTDALGRLTEKITAGPGEFTTSPGYEFRLAEGQKAIERSAAARGSALSGATMKAATEYGQNFATADYDNFLRRYYESLVPDQTLADRGQSAAEQIGRYGMEGAGRIGDYTMTGAGKIGDYTMDTGRSLADLGYKSTNAMGESQLYGADVIATGATDAANIMAAQKAAAAERDEAYNAWKYGKNW